MVTIPAASLTDEKVLRRFLQELVSNLNSENAQLKARIEQLERQLAAKDSGN